MATEVYRELELEAKTQIYAAKGLDVEFDAYNFIEAAYLEFSWGTYHSVEARDLEWDWQVNFKVSRDFIWSWDVGQFLYSEKEFYVAGVEVSSELEIGWDTHNALESFRDITWVVAPITAPTETLIPRPETTYCLEFVDRTYVLERKHGSSGL